MTYQELFNKYLEWYNAYKEFYGEYPQNVWMLQDKELEKLFESSY